MTTTPLHQPPGAPDTTLLALLDSLVDVVDPEKLRDGFERKLFDQALRGQSDGAIDALEKLEGLWKLIERQRLQRGLYKTQPEASDAIAWARSSHYRDLYWRLAQQEQAGRSAATSACLRRTRLWIAQHLLPDFGGPIGSLSEETIRFLSAMTTPHSGGSIAATHLPPTKDERASMGIARPSEEHRRHILDALRERLNDPVFSVDACERWLMHPCVSPELKQLFAQCRAKRGGPELAQHDVRNARLLDPSTLGAHDPASVVTLGLRLTELLAGLQHAADEINDAYSAELMRGTSGVVRTVRERIVDTIIRIEGIHGQQLEIDVTVSLGIGPSLPAAVARRVLKVAARQVEALTRALALHQGPAVTIVLRRCGEPVDLRPDSWTTQPTTT